MAYPNVPFGNIDTQTAAEATELEYTCRGEDPGWTGLRESVRLPDRRAEPGLGSRGPSACLPGRPFPAEKRVAEGKRSPWIL